MRKLLFILLILSVTAVTSASAQILKPVKWSYAAKKTGENEVVVFLKATIEDGWHMYSQHVKKGGPVKTSFTFAPSQAYSLVGNTIEPKPVTQYQDLFKMDVSYFEDEVIFQQKVKLNAKGQTVVKGKLEYMVCDDQQCLPPTEVEFAIPIK